MQDVIKASMLILDMLLVSVKNDWHGRSELDVCEFRTGTNKFVGLSLLSGLVCLSPIAICFSVRLLKSFFDHNNRPFSKILRINTCFKKKRI